MRKLLSAGLCAFLIPPLASLIGPANAWGDAGDDALSAFMSMNYPRAFQLARPAAEAGNYMAQYLLGRIYEEGDGVPKDKTEAEKWFRQALSQIKPAAQNGDPRAQTTLGAMYILGQGVAKNYEEAKSWTRKAEEQGCALAQYNLGYMYSQGQGVAKSPEEGLSWFRKAAEQGDASAQYALGSMYYQGQGTAKNYDKAVAWFRKAAEQGNLPAQYMLGVMDAIGQGGAKNPEEAVTWYRKAAEQGFGQAQYSLGIVYENGLWGVGRDDAQALSWYRKAADQDFMPPSRDHKPGDLWDDARATRSERRSQPSPVAAASVSREDIQAMVQAASKEAAKSPPPAPKPVDSDVDTPGYKSPENPNNFAVVIGVEKYAALPSAEFAERDAQAVRAHLMALGYPARNIYFLDGQQATRAKIAQSVNTWLPNRVGADSTVFFYYSGHGAPDPQTNQAYLVPVDGDAEDLDSTAYPINQLYAKLGRLKARHVIVALDSCFSGAGGRSVLAKGARPLVSKIDLGIVPDKVIALTASDKSQISGTMEEQGHGAFTYYLLKGLAGAAQNGSGHVTVQSLYDYLTPKVQDAARLHNRDQTPQLLPANGEKAGISLR